jgi:hypothetical protein
LIRVYVYWSQIEPQPGRRSFGHDCPVELRDGQVRLMVSVTPVFVGSREP